MAEEKETTTGAEKQDPMDRLLAMADLLEKVLPGVTSLIGEKSPELVDVATTLSSGKASLLSRLTPRMLACLVLAGILAAGVAVLSPAQLPVAAYKLSLLTIAGYLGYWLDRWCFPYARPDSFLVAADWRADNKPAAERANNPVVPGCEQVYAAAMLRRALVMLGAMVTMGLGL